MLRKIFFFQKKLFFLFILTISIFFLIFTSIKTEEKKDIRSKAKETPPETQLSFSSSPDFLLQKDNSLNVLLLAGNYKIGALKYKITYDSQKLLLKEIKPGKNFLMISSPTFSPKINPEGNLSTIYFTQIVVPPTPFPSGTINTLEIIFFAQSLGKTKISVSAEEITRYEPSLGTKSHLLNANGIEKEFQIVSSDTPTPTSTPPPLPPSLKPTSILSPR